MSGAIQSVASGPQTCVQPDHSANVSDVASTPTPTGASVASSSEGVSVRKSDATEAALGEARASLGGGAGRLVAAHSRSPAADFFNHQAKSLGSGGAPESTLDNSNQERTQGRLQGPYAASGVTSDGNTIFVGAAAGKGEAPDGSGRSEVFSVSAQAGAQFEVQAAVARLEIGTSDTHFGGKALEAEIHAGLYNADGSRGLNLGATATLVGGEAQATLSGNSATFGVALSAGAEASLGLRDQDSDGQAEYCGRVSAGPMTAGLCIEPGAIIETVRELF